MTITVFEAHRIITMHPARPSATHVAVRDGRILAVGGLDEVAGWGAYTLDTRFAHQVLMPGLVEGHSHLMAGTLWRYVYCGYFDTTDPAGRVWPGLKTLDEVVAALGAAAALSTDASAGGPVVGWGFDPIYFGQQRCSRADLDRVSTSRPVGLLHASAHILNVNTAALQACGTLRTGIDHAAFPLGADGLPTGELKGPEAMLPALDHVGLNRSFLSGDETGIRNFARLCVRAGVTTATDLAATLGDDEVATLTRLTGEQDFPVRIVPLLRLIGTTPAVAVARAQVLATRSTQQLRLGGIKVVADGSIQGFSARLRWPGYFNGSPNGFWYTAPEAIREAYTLALRAGVQIHTHTNGDEATDLALDCMAAALAAAPTPDHRYTLQHCQLADDAQFRRMAALGAEHSATVISLAGGCLCCSFGDDLVGTLATLAARRPPLDVCLIELSGVALPASVARSARLVQAVEVVATLVLADAEHIQQQAVDRYVGDTVRQQLRDADWLMLNKLDLVTPAALQATSDWLQQMQPQARLWAGDVQAVWPELLLHWRAGDLQGLAPHTPIKSINSINKPHAAPRGQLKRRMTPWLLPAPHAAAVFESYACVLPEAVNLAALGRLLSTRASGVLRAKALVAGQSLQVAGGRWAVTAVASAAGGQLVMIGLRGWNPQALLSGLDGALCV